MHEKNLNDARSNSSVSCNRNYITFFKMLKLKKKQFIQNQEIVHESIIISYCVYHIPDQLINDKLNRNIKFYIEDNIFVKITEIFLCVIHIFIRTEISILIN